MRVNSCRGRLILSLWQEITERQLLDMSLNTKDCFIYTFVLNCAQRLATQVKDHDSKFDSGDVCPLCSGSRVPGLTCRTSSDLLEQIGWEEAELPPRADLQVAVDLLAFLHYNLGNEEQGICGSGPAIASGNKLC